MNESLTLYSLTDDLSQLMATRSEMADNGEDTAAIDAEIAAYMQSLPEKIDSVAHVVRALEAQRDLALAEKHRIEARAKRFQDNLEHLKRYVVDVMEGLPEPKRGCKKLEGSTSTLVLKENGGLAPLEIADPAIVSDELCEAIVTVPWTIWKRMTPLYASDRAVTDKAIRVPNNAAIRKALGEPCWLCQGTDSACTSCGGSGKNGVPGARLLERGHHVEIK